VCSDITFDPAARRFDSGRFPIEATLQDAYGPWPDVWGADADHAALAAAAGLHCVAAHDITAHTLPSHRFTAPAGNDLRRRIDESADNPALRAALMLKWLHTEGHLRYHCFRFDKAGVHR
jgi:hypothetical protein